MNNQGRTNIILIIAFSLIIHISLIFLAIELNKKPSEIIEYRPVYTYNIKVEVSNPPVETKPETKLKAEPKVESKPEPKEESKPKETLSEDTYLLAKIINAEAKDQPYSGKVAVGNVIMNRVESPQFPDTIRDVVYQKGQFSPVANGSINKEPSKESIKAAQDVINGKQVVGEEVLYFYNPDISTSDWIFSREVVTTIGDHAFAT